MTTLTTKASRDFNVSIGSLYDWNNIYDSQGIEGLSSSRKEDTATVENRRLKRENDELKKLVAEKELELKIKNDMLKKSTLQKKTKK